MPETITIALDAMGGDHGPKAVIPGAARAIKTDPDLKFILFGRQTDIEAELKHYPSLRGLCLIHHTDQVIASDEKAATALRQGRESSMRKAIDAVAEKRAACVVSSGNTDGDCQNCSEMFARDSSPGDRVRFPDHQGPDRDA
jgi:phosphate acyltransferase